MRCRRVDEGTSAANLLIDGPLPTIELKNGLIALCGIMTIRLDARSGVTTQIAKRFLFCILKLPANDTIGINVDKILQFDRNSVIFLIPGRR